MKTKIMFCGVNNLTDARFAAAIGSEWLGFDLDPASPAYVDPDKAAVIKGWLSGPQYFGEFAANQIKYISDLQEKLQLDFAYVKGYPDVQDLAGLPMPVIKEIAAADMSADQLSEAFVTYSRHARLFVLKIGLHELPGVEAGIFNTYPVLIRSEISAGAVEKLLRTYRPEGICLNGGREDKTGMRDFEDLQKIIDVLMMED